MSRRVDGLRLLATILSVLLCVGAYAQGFPDRTIRLIAPTTAGSPADVLARLVGDAMARVLHASVVVENRAGALAP